MNPIAVSGEPRRTDHGRRTTIHCSCSRLSARRNHSFNICQPRVAVLRQYGRDFSFGTAYGNFSTTSCSPGISAKYLAFDVSSRKSR
jgi:hypothetical protein